MTRDDDHDAPGRPSADHADAVGDQPRAPQPSRDTQGDPLNNASARPADDAGDATGGAAPSQDAAGAAGRSPAAEPVTPSRRRKALPIWQEVLVLLATAFVLALVVKTFFVQAFYIPSVSMQPTLQIDDKILVQKVSYWAGDVERGDVVVFRDPGGWLSPAQGDPAHNVVQQGLEAVGLYPSGGHLVKRVIAVEGDTVRCCDEDGRIVVNGEPLDEAWLPARTQNQGRYNQTVPEGRIWVLGDNRANSEDSHAHLGDPGGGMVPVEDVVGKVWAVVWPLDRAEVLDTPEVYAAVPEDPAQ